MPTQGLKMRCPKCGAKFHVTREGEIVADSANGVEDLPTPRRSGTAAPQVPGELDLPALRAPDKHADLPAPVRRKLAPAYAPPPPRPVERTDGGADLPAPPGVIDLPAPRTPTADIELPALRGVVDLPAPRTPTADIDLPALRGVVDLPAPRTATADIDLPAPRGVIDLPVPRTATADIDLPAPRGVIDLPAPRTATADIDLPAPRTHRAKTGDIELDLPALRGVVDLPAPRTATADIELDLPAPRTPRAKTGDIELDLPTPRGVVDLPAPRVRSATSDLVDLPVARVRPATSDLELDLPTPKQASQNLDLPTLAGSIDLPALNADLPKPIARVELKRSRLADLPALSGGLDLPIPKGHANLPQAIEAIDLPEVGGLELPMPMPTGNVGGLDLELDIGPSDAPTPFDDFGIDLPDLEDDLDSDLGSNNHGSNHSGFGSDLPGLGDDDLSLPPPRPRGSAGQTPDGRAGAGGMSFGELDLGGGDGGPDLADLHEGNLEFDEFPDQRDSAMDDLDPDLDLPDSHAPATRRRSNKTASAPVSTRKSPKGVAIFAGVLLLVAGAGIAMKWTPLGLFGMHYLEQYRPEAGDATRTDAAVMAADELASDDSYGGARAALRSLGAARNSMYLNRGLQTASIVYEALFQHRFGEDLDSEAREGRIFNRLETRGDDAPGINLARAANSLRRGDLAAAQLSVAAAKNTGRNDVLVHLVDGEISLAQGRFAQARAAFQAAGEDTRALWGLARVALNDPESDDATQETALETTIEANPNHAGALVSQAERLSRAGQGQEAIEIALRAANPEQQEFRGSVSERADAYTVMGHQYELSGRRGQARSAFVAARTLVPFQVEALLGLGRLGLRDRRFLDAQTHFSAAIQAAQDLPAITEGGLTPSAEAELGSARALVALEQPQEALAATTHLRADYPQNADVALVHGQILGVLQRNEEAAVAYDVAIEAAPDRFEPYLARAGLFTAAGQTNEADAILIRAREAVEMTPEIHRMIGDAEYEAGDLEGAILEYRLALQGSPDMPDALFGLGKSLRRLRRPTQAVIHLDHLAELDPGFPSLAMERGMLFEALGQSQRAVRSFARALETNPDDLDLQLRLGGAQVAAGLPEEGEATLSPVAAARPDSAEVAYFMGRAAFARGETTLALERLGRAVSLDSSIALYHLYNGWALFEANQLGRASGEIATALGLDEQLAEAYYVRGLIRVRSGAVTDAEVDFRRTLELNPRLAGAHAGIGEAHAQRGRRADAIASFTRATTMDGTEGRWWFRLGELRADQGDRRGGAAALQRAAALISELENPRAPWTYETYRALGDALLSSDRRAARAAYTTYLERSPASALDRDQVEERLGRI